MADVTWVGGAVGNWATGSNWSSGSVPGITDRAVFNQNVTVTVDSVQRPGSVLLAANVEVTKVGISTLEIGNTTSGGRSFEFTVGSGGRFVVEEGSLLGGQFVTNAVGDVSVNGDGVTYQWAGPGSNTQNITIGDAFNGTFTVVGQSTSFDGVISGFNAGEFVNWSAMGTAASNVDYAANTVTLTRGSDTVTFRFAEDFTPGQFTVSEFGVITTNRSATPGGGDVTPPTVSIGLSDTALRAGETSLVTFTFSEAVTGFSAADVTTENGTLSGFSSSDGGITWSATFTPTSGVEDVANVISVNLSGIQDQAGNAGSGTVSSPSYSIDTAVPTTPGAPDLAFASDTGFSSTDNITSALRPSFSGVSEANANIELRADGQIVGTATVNGDGTYTVSPTADLPEGSVAITVVARDAAGNVSVASAPLNITIDRTASTAVLSAAVVGDGALGQTDVSGNVVITGAIGSDILGPGETVQVTVGSGSPQQATIAPDGLSYSISVPGSSLGTEGAPAAISARIVDAAGNRTSPVASSVFTIDATLPTASVTISDTALRLGETATVTILFSEPVAGFTNADLTFGNGSLSDVTSADGGQTFTATFTPASNLSDASNFISLNLTGVTDLAGNSGLGTVSSQNFSINTVRPVDPSAPIVGTIGNDVLNGSSLPNQIEAGAGNDTVSAGFGDDTVLGNQGDDLLTGNQGSDILYGGQGKDTVYGGQGDDTAYGNLGDDLVFGNLGADLVLGNEGNDTVTGNEGDDTVYGGQGNDLVFGGQDNDLLYGNLGDDTLVGGLGNDTLEGGAGADTFQFATSSGVDVITDFNLSEGDRLDFQGQTYTVADTYSIAVFTLSGGGTVILNGVSSASLDLFAFA